MKRMDDEGAGHRHARLQSLVLQELRSLFRDDVDDPSLASVRVQAAVLSVDYRHVRAHYGTLAGAPPRATVAHALERASRFLRARLAEALDLKRAPDLSFVYDGELVGGGDEEDPPCSG